MEEWDYIQTNDVRKTPLRKNTFRELNVGLLCVPRCSRCVCGSMGGRQSNPGRHQVGCSDTLFLW